MLDLLRSIACDRKAIAMQLHVSIQMRAPNQEVPLRLPGFSATARLTESSDTSPAFLFAKLIFTKFSPFVWGSVLFYVDSVLSRASKPAVRNLQLRRCLCSCARRSPRPRSGRALSSSCYSRPRRGPVAFVAAIRAAAEACAKIEAKSCKTLA